MIVSIDWGAVVAIFVALGALGAFLHWSVRSIVRDELQSLDDTFVRSEESHLTGAEIDRRLRHLEATR